MSQISLPMCSLYHVRKCIFSNTTVLKKNPKPFYHKRILSSAIYLLFYGRGFCTVETYIDLGLSIPFQSLNCVLRTFFPLSNFPLLPINPHNLQSLSIFLLNLSGFSEVSVMIFLLVKLVE